MIAPRRVHPDLASKSVPSAKVASSAESFASNNGGESTITISAESRARHHRLSRLIATDSPGAV